MESISINDLLWVQWKRHLLSFNYLGMPKGLHYTIAFNENSPFVNLHLTKNAEQTNNKEKPKIEICKIRKNDFFEIAPKILIGLLSYVLEEVQELKNYRGYCFISFEQIENEGVENKVIEKELFENFKDITKLKQNKRLKIKGEIESRLDKFSENEEIQEMIMNKFVCFKQDIKSKGGILVFENETINLLKIQNKWFKLNLEIDWEIALNKILGNRLFNHFKNYIAESLKIIEQAEDYDDCKKNDNSITLEIRRPATNNV